MKELFKKNPPRMLFYSGLILVVIVTAIGLFAALTGKGQTDPNVLATVGNEKITKADLNKAIYGADFQGTPENPKTAVSDEGKKELLNALIEAKLVEDEAKKLGITASEQEIQEQITYSLGNKYAGYTDQNKELTKQAAKTTVLTNKIKINKIGWREGKFLVFNFHKYFSTEIEAYKTAQMGNQTLIDQQKLAAENLAKKISEELKAGKLDYEKAKEELMADPNVGREAMRPRTPIMDGTFTKDDFFKGSTLFNKAGLVDAVIGLKKGDVSNPVADKGIAEAEGKEYRYIVFIIDNASEGSYKNYEEWLDAKKKEVQIKSYTPLLSVLPAWVPNANPAYAAEARSCAACSTDNADVRATVYYMRSDGVKKFLPGIKVVIQGGNAEDPAVTPNANNTGCTTKLGQIDAISNTSGSSNLCDNGYSYFCATNNIAYLKLPYVGPTDSSSDDVDRNLANTDKMTGEWTWDTKSWNYIDGGVPDWQIDMRPQYEHKAYLKFQRGTSWANGSAITNEFTWHPNYLPTPHPYSEDTLKAPYTNDTISPDNNAPYQDVTKKIQLAGYAVDNGGGTDSQNIRVMYKKIAGVDMDGKWHSFGTQPKTVPEARQSCETNSVFCSIPNGKTATGTTYWDVNEAGYSPVKNNGVVARMPVLTVAELGGEGKYAWRVQSKEDNGAVSGWSEEWTFTVGSSITVTDQLTCSVEPQVGQAPMTVQVTAKYGSATTGFNYDMGDGGVYTNRPNTVQYTYGAVDVDTPRTITVTVNGSTDNCTANVTVKPPKDGSGGEVSQAELIRSYL